MQNNDAKEQSFIRLIKEYGPTITKVCYFYAVDSDDLNDLRQEVMINLWRGFDRYRGEPSPSTWIYRVSLNSCVSYFRKHKRHQSEYTSIDSIPEIYDSGSEKPDRLREMYNLINRLDRVEKALILLWLSDRKYDDIADIMGIPRNTVASRLHRIKEKLVKYSNE